jgi:hypothetical protein
MARYTVQMTFEVPTLAAPLGSTHRLPGRAAWVRLLGADGMLAVSASRVQAESPAEAAMIVVKSVHDRWPKGRGPIKMLSWTAGRERVLTGVRRGSSGSGGPWPDDWHLTFGSDDSDGGDDESGGSAGVREPRRPLPGPGSMHAAVELPRSRPEG